MSSYFDELGVEMDEQAENMNQNIDTGKDEKKQDTGKGLKDLILAQTGDGDLDSYKDTPLNFNNSDGLAQVIRGLNGLIREYFGQAIDNLAVLDIGIGMYRLKVDVAESKAQKTEDTGVEKSVYG